jgi:hypothetical protein
MLGMPIDIPTNGALCPGDLLRHPSLTFHTAPAKARECLDRSKLVPAAAGRAVGQSRASVPMAWIYSLVRELDEHRHPESPLN